MIDLWPKEYETGLIKTANAMGVMTTEFSPVALRFIEGSKQAKKPVLDIGSAYGAVTHAALENGATVISCDVSSVHLDILYKTSPKNALHRLTLDNSSFPDQTNYESSSLSSILISLVLHFLDGDSVDRGLKKCYDWLEPGGRLFVVVMTPNLSFYQKAWPEYRRNVSLGEKWPGIFNTKDLAPDDIIGYLPSFVHLFDENILVRSVVNAGFQVCDTSFFCYKNFPDKHRTNGQEFIGIVGVK